MNNAIEIMGVKISNLSFQETVEYLTDRINKKRLDGFHLITANPEIVMTFQKDHVLQQIVNEANFITPDGVGIVLASKWNGTPIRERVTGCDLLIRLLTNGNQHDWSFYILGAAKDVNEMAVHKMKEEHPNVKIVGQHHGYFNEEEEKKIIRDIERAKPDIVVVALGAPAAEKWIYEHKDRLKSSLVFGVGGSLDIIAGKVKRAPVIWQKLNLEWLHRLITQPSRIKRQWILPVFAVNAFFHRKK